MGEITKLIMFSGGLDSTYVLWKSLQNNDDIWVHHIILKNDYQPRWREELEAARKIIQKLKKDFRDFPYTESEWSMTIDKDDNGGMIWDSDVVAFVAAQLIYYIKSDRVQLVTGKCLEDESREITITQRKFSQLIWEAASEKFREKTDTKIQHPIGFTPKKDLIKELPDELLDMIWTCMFPEKGKPCGKCFSCTDIKNAKNKNNL